MTTNIEIARQRLANQGLSQARFTRPEEVVRWLGAVQAQEYAYAKWGLGLRLKGMKASDVESALTAGKILRTHVMRPTWHFVTAEDIRWMLDLTAPRVHIVNGTMYRKLNLNQGLLTRSADIILRALEGGHQLTRLELGRVLAQAGIEADTMRLGYIVHYAELEGIICSGARRGKQFTYALIAERAPQARSLPREEALAALVSRFFCSHGPATLADFVRWSGLTQAETKMGLEMVNDVIVHKQVDGKDYWRSKDVLPDSITGPKALLLPPYDEMTIGYKDNSAILEDKFMPLAINEVYGGAAFINHRILGYWKRTLAKNRVIVEVNPFRAWTDEERHTYAASALAFGEFLEMPVDVIIH